MNDLAPVEVLLLGTFPGRLNHLGILQFIKDAITAQDNEIVVFFDLETFDVGIGNHHLGIASILHSLGLYIAKGS